MLIQDHTFANHSGHDDYWRMRGAYWACAAMLNTAMYFHYICMCKIWPSPDSGTTVDTTESLCPYEFKSNWRFHNVKCRDYSKYPLQLLRKVLTSLNWLDKWRQLKLKYLLNEIGTRKRIKLQHQHAAYKRRDSSVVQRVVGWSGVRVAVGAGNFSPHRREQTGSGTHPASYSMGTRGSFPGDKADGV